MATLADQYLAFREHMRTFNEWEESQPGDTRDLSLRLADLSAFWSWLPEHARMADPDPEKEGFKKFRELVRLAHASHEPR